MFYSDLKDDINAFLKNNALWIALAIVGAIIITLVIIFVIRVNLKKQKDSIANTTNDEWINALGGKDNILEVNANGSRLSVKLKALENENKEELKKLGVSNIVTMSDKLVLVVEDKAELIKEKLQ